ncbi:MAG: hypothetical protein HYY42_01615 [Chloroflexi bacterium]|nr:hypothetical protein [Chloroflexota bacterium]
MIARWPAAGARDAALEERFDLALEVVRAARALRQEAGVDPSRRASVSLSGQTGGIAGLTEVIATLVNGDVALREGSGPSKTARAVEVRVEAERDIAAERARLDRELTEAREALRRSEELLARPGFAEQAPKPVIDKERARLEERRAQLALLEEELRRIG